MYRKAGRPSRCSFAGHTELNLKRIDEFIQELEEAIALKISQGCKSFYSGMTGVFDVLAARIVLEERELDPSIRLLVVVPKMEDERNLFSNKEYNSILSNADERIIMGIPNDDSSYYRRNLYMVNNSDHLIAGYDPMSTGKVKYTVDVARNRGLNMIIIDPTHY